MYLKIDGHQIEAKTDQSLLELLQELNLVGGSLSEQPLAAKIAGEVFTLNYIPRRQKDGTPERPSMRRAMEASDGEVRLLRYRDPAGKECYIRTAQFVIFLALRQLWPEARTKMNCTLGSSVFIQVMGAENFSVSVLKKQISDIIAKNIPLIRRRVPLKDAIAATPWKGSWIRRGFFPGEPWIILMYILTAISRIIITVKCCRPPVI